MKMQNNEPPEERSLSRHILPSSGTMVGVCVTLIGLVKIVETRTGPSRVDEYVALTTFLFLASAVSSYISMRHPERPRLSARCEMVADQCFLVGLIGITLLALFFAYEII